MVLIKLPQATCRDVLTVDNTPARCTCTRTHLHHSHARQTTARVASLTCVCVHRRGTLLSDYQIVVQEMEGVSCMRCHAFVSLHGPNGESSLPRLPALSRFCQPYAAFMSGSWGERRKELACACMTQTERDGESNIIKELEGTRRCRRGCRCHC